MSVELLCTAQECTAGVGGERWKTQELPEALALQTLDRHLLGHGLQIPGGGNSDGGNRSRLEKLPRPSISAGCNQQDFQFFREQWTRYKRASGESDEAKLRDQLMYCPDEALRKHVSRSLGARVDTITEVDLLKEIEMLAVERQSNLVNIVALMSATQERDEVVRKFVARLRGLAAVCDLTVVCECTKKVSVVENWILMALVKGLNDEDTKQEVMSKVVEMSIDETIAFVEARETGKKSMNTLSGGGMASSQMNKVNTAYKAQEMEPQTNQERCNYCGTKGHGKNPNFDLKKASCPAFNNKCKQCKRKGHFQDFCSRNRSENKEISGNTNDKTRAENKSMRVMKMKFTDKISKEGLSKSQINQVRNQQKMP